VSHAPSPKTVLVVDDDDTLREAIVFDFQRRGYRTLSAENGADAFELVKSEKIDVVITDMRMPKGTGVELLDWIKEMKVPTPVIIFITGFTDLSLEEAYAKGASAVMSKPFERKRLIETVQRSLQTDAEKFDTPASATQTDRTLNRNDTFSFGLGGMAVTSEDPAVVGEIVSFGLTHPTPTLPTLVGQGVVRWINEPKKGFGVEFVYIDESCRQNLVKFLGELNTIAFIPRAG
jgi:CheY-like chemotaxis protein